MQFERPQVVKHCARMQERIRDRSYFDDSSGTYINSLTWNGPFWKGVHDYLALKVCPLDESLCWKWSKFKEDHGDDVHQVKARIFPSKDTVLQITNDMKDGKGKGNDTTSRATSHSVRCLTDSNQQ